MVAEAMWWLGGHTSIIEPLRGPTCKLELCKISSRVEIPSWTRVWQNQISILTSSAEPSVLDRSNTDSCFKLLKTQPILSTTSTLTTVF